MLFYLILIARVTTNKFPISILDWDILGKYLVVGDISGNIQIFVQKENLLSEWVQYYHVRLPGEHIIKAAFFHNGRKLVLQPDKKDITNYMDKFQRAKFLPSCRSFGGVPADGVLVVTATGLLGAFLIPPDLPNLNKLASTLSPPTLPQILTPVTQSLGRTRSFITIADICYSKSMRQKNDHSNFELGINRYALSFQMEILWSLLPTERMKIQHHQWFIAIAFQWKSKWTV